MAKGRRTRTTKEPLKLKAGQILTRIYKHRPRALLVAIDEDGAQCFILDTGRAFGSLSEAARYVMGVASANGRLFWVEYRKSKALGHPKRDGGLP